MTEYRQRILLAAFKLTPRKEGEKPDPRKVDVATHFELLHKLDFAVELAGEKWLPNVEGDFDLVVQMGLGELVEIEEGLEYTRKLREKFPSAHLLVLSGNDPANVLERVREKGGDEYLQRYRDEERGEFLAKVIEFFNRPPGN